MSSVLSPTGIESTAAQIEERAYSKVTWRFIPFLVLCYMVAYLDRVNIGFAKLQMLNDLKFSETVYGLGAGIFFLGFFILEIPSNLFLHRLGARVWIARIMISWGVISGAMMFVTTPMQFYVLRFLLGMAEAGFYPGIILYLTYWYPAERRGRVTALFSTGVPLAGVLGSPLSAWIMKSFGGVHGLAGWQWLYLIEAIPSIIVGFLTIFYLKNGIRHAHFLNEEEKKILEANIKRDSRQKEDHSLRHVFGSGKVWFMTLIYFCFIMGFYGVGFWLPTLVKQTGVKDLLNVGLLTAIPFTAAAITMILVARSADRSGKRRTHLAAISVLGGVGLIISAAYSDNIVIGMAGLTLGTMGALSTLPLFWSLPTAFMGGTAAAAGIALINSFGNLAGFVAPYMIGWLKDLTHSTNMGMYVLAASLFIGAVLVMAVPAKLVDKVSKK